MSCSCCRKTIASFLLMKSWRPNSWARRSQQLTRTSYRRSCYLGLYHENTYRNPFINYFYVHYQIASMRVYDTSVNIFLRPSTRIYEATCLRNFLYAGIEAFYWKLSHDLKLQIRMLNWRQWRVNIAENLTKRSVSINFWPLEVVQSVAKH